MSQTPTNQQLTAELRRLADEFDTTAPRSRQIQTESEYSLRDFYDAFGSLRDARVAAGLDRQASVGRIGKPELLEALRRLAAELNRPPTIPDFQNRVEEYSMSSINQQFDSFSQALDEAGLDSSGPHHRVPKSAYISDLKTVHKELDEADLRGGEYMAMESYTNHPNSNHTAKTIASRFESWTDALAQAGLPDRPRRDRDPKYTREHMLYEIQSLADEFGEPPTEEQFDEHAAFSSGVVFREFETWNDAIEACGLDPRPGKIQREELLSELHRLADEIDSVPTTTDMRKNGKHSMSPYYTEFGSWTSAIEEAGLDSTE